MLTISNSINQIQDKEVMIKDNYKIRLIMHKMHYQNLWRDPVRKKLAVQIFIIISKPLILINLAYLPTKVHIKIPQI